ncbi:low molecular weight protein-tyrosine-phosphatase [Actinobaculum massiliense]|uniref:protein-tyrosine-phosphatase n=1 Tax=Actinobaculum massiliense ACS-171-V-Col2 TaxID=883066 RepID=K9EY59_9ACTO|nr:low molecular weight protein-tyrosine-phosphatase [Actinobaculum massiliense]EKU95872.1 hypothetical protein HMPREF9233_00659 [Actinobaculum massiliense ACS-171-V-Col2]MDK8566419.1 low molecular weight protein-tyrosine-phosphatase [Actinobaculum massiliense]
MVCTGNICRSPMGEVVLREKLVRAGVEITVESAGVSNEEQGNGVYPPAQRSLRARGYVVPQRRAHRVTREELSNSGLILAMTSGHARALRRMMDSANLDTGVIHLWREFDGSGLGPFEHGVFGEGGLLEQTGENSRKRRNTTSDLYYSSGEWDVPDPWGGDDSEFERTLDVVEKGADGLVELLKNRR